MSRCPLARLAARPQEDASLHWETNVREGRAKYVSQCVPVSALGILVNAGS